MEGMYDFVDIFDRYHLYGLSTAVVWLLDT